MKNERIYIIAFVIVTILLAALGLAGLLAEHPSSVGYSPLLAPTRDRLTIANPTPTPRQTETTPGNMLSNPGFEGGYINCGDACNVAPGWTAYGAPGNPPPCIPNTLGCDIVCPSNCNDCNPDHIDYGCWWCKPEHKAATLQFPERVHSGEYAQQLFCYGRQCIGGVYQVVPAVVGARVRASVWVQNWQCAYNDGCGGMSDNPASGLMRARIGIDPLGGYDDAAPSIVWSDTNEGRDFYEQIAVEAIAQVPQVTVFLEFAPSWGWAHMHNNVYFDDAALVSLLPPTPTLTPVPTTTPGPMTERNYMPIIARNYSAPTPTPTPRPPTPTPAPTPTGTLYSLVWFSPSDVSVGATDTYTVSLYVYTSEILGDVELVLAAFVRDGIEIVNVTPGSYFAAIPRFAVGNDNGLLTIDAIGRAAAGRSRPLAILTLRGHGSIMPITNYSTFIGTSSGGGITPETKGFIAK